MKKILFILFSLLYTFNCFSQISFDEGYFIDNIGVKTKCYIKNDNYSDITKNLSYKLSEKGKTQAVNLKTIKEIVIFNTNKFIKQKVDIGRPDEFNLNDTDYKFKTEEIFLKVLVEGTANLYSYKEKGIETFFFSFNGLEINQLVYKVWISENSVQRENNSYRKQLFDNLTCGTINFNTANNLKYERKNLVDFFVQFNNCKGSNIIVYNSKTKTFNVNLRTRLNFTSLNLDEREGRINPRTHDFGKETLFGFGIEFEALLPFLKNKWAVSVEPTYDGEFKSEIIFDNDVNIGESVSVRYKAFNIPLTLRHYLYINTDSKIFLNASVVFDFPIKSNYIVYKINDNIIENLNPEGSANFAFGGGYKLKNKYSVEARYYTNRNIINQSIDYSTSYSMVSVILAYTLF
ncbi:hypothetical protein APS56_02945 [Pseudalgibacter alginicilyticus]|uniref:tRNA modification GTPase n=1 Tax=Pseudalgibacter alginicilyticus TaxID=1736674 RepID=A0A0P0CDP7_9FLAO|nr:hypothetical protein [Pseudalgibacter alginicilyticus]ALJ04167.1 hypothetical protein APS56_02945 [Pseudalgibacter alginicilyticus]